MVVLVVPQGTAEILANAYRGRADITEVRLPPSVKSIGPCAFFRCTGITTLLIPEGLESIGNGAFNHCAGVTDLRLPASLLSLGDDAFYSCTGIASLHIPGMVQCIGARAFASCSGIVDLHLPGGLRSIGANAFGCCTGIETLVLPVGLTSIGEAYPWGAVAGAFAGCTRLARVVAPDALAKGAMADPAKVFADCPVLGVGLTRFSSVKLQWRRFWHPSMHAWCTPAAKACVLAVLIAELRVDQNARGQLPHHVHTPAPLPYLPHELWLRILAFAPRRELGTPPPAA